MARMPAASSSAPVHQSAPWIQPLAVERRCPYMTFSRMRMALPAANGPTIPAITNPVKELKKPEVPHHTAWAINKGATATSTSMVFMLNCKPGGGVGVEPDVDTLHQCAKDFDQGHEH